jgi:F420H(2)-dependent quinone reductase
MVSTPDFGRTLDRLKPVVGAVTRAHIALYRRTGGRLGHSIPGMPTMLLLDHVGARSGRKRTTPLVYMPDGGDFVVVAAKGGYPRNPSWAHNLRAHPQTEVQIGSRRISVRAREAGAEERRRLWPAATEYNPLWDGYQRRTSRTIPIFVLEPSIGEARDRG